MCTPQPAERAVRQPRLAAVALHVVHPDGPRALAERGLAVRLAAVEAELPADHRGFVRGEPVVAHRAPLAGVVDLHAAFLGRAAVDQAHVALCRAVRCAGAARRGRRPVAGALGVRGPHPYLVAGLGSEALDALRGAGAGVVCVRPVPARLAVLDVVVRDRRSRCRRALTTTPRATSSRRSASARTARRAPPAAAPRSSPKPGTITAGRPACRWPPRCRTLRSSPGASPSRRRGRTGGS